MDQHHVIAFGSLLWWTGILFSVITIAILLSIGRKTGHKSRQQIILIFGIAIASSEIIRHIISITNGSWGLTTHLPFQLCNISFWTSVFLLTRKQPMLLYEYIVMLGIPGAIQAFLTPEMTTGYSKFLVFNYYFTHTGILLAGLYLTIILGMRPRRGSWLKVFLLGQAILGFVGLVNRITGANYIYLCQKPLADTPLIIGEWPWYLLGLEVIGLAHIALFYFIFRFWIPWKKNS